MGNTLTINIALTPTLHNDMLIIKEKLDLPPVTIEFYTITRLIVRALVKNINFFLLYLAAIILRSF